MVGNTEFWPLGNWASYTAAKVVPLDENNAAFEKTGKFATPGWQKVLDLLAERHVVGGFNKDMQGLCADPAMATFFQQTAVRHPIGSWLITAALEKGDLAFRCAQFATPVIDDAHPLKDAVIGPFTGFIIHNNAKNPAAAIGFLKFFTNKASARLWTEGGNISPVLGADERVAMDEQSLSIVAVLARASVIVHPPDTTYRVPLTEAWY